MTEATLAFEPKSSGTSANKSLVVQRSPPSRGQLLVATVFAVINWESRQILAFRLQIGAPVDVVAGAEVVVPEVVDNEEVLEVTVADVVDDKLEDDVEAPMGPTDEEAETELVDEDVEAAVEPSEEVELEVDVEAPMGPTDEDAEIELADEDVEAPMGPTDEEVEVELADEDVEAGVEPSDEVDTEFVVEKVDVEAPMGPTAEELEIELADEDVEDAVEPSDEVDTELVGEKVDVEAPMGPAVEAEDELVKKLGVDVELLIGPTDDEADAEVVDVEVKPLIGPIDDEVDADVVDEDESEVEEVLPLIGPTALLAVEDDTAILDAEVEVLLWEFEDADLWSC
ncbi:hypothetical protein LTR47_009607 [Exophiala xenobiotica]|nr:hypothetical protein LTR41_010933 [Exophiala xenobiotica]KAK5225182.1 hypothetical protein LTR47_009607 [Exophiala xenobiotica]KAK5243840.1 hypothetical protein LTS06_010466 [Exophiala xenobiotica]KAK5315538.1 hypothetical protein LTR93_009793 [Exophiala xenobiotica]KAK5390030.1 hypothetical protein LTS13_000110 [Exophiala xenobiotica]